MNDPFANLDPKSTSSPSAISQSQTYAGQMLADKDFSAEKHKQISLEVLGAWLAGTDDIGMREEARYNKEPEDLEGLPIPEGYLESRPHGTIEQGLALLRAYKKQEDQLRSLGKAGMDYDYVRDRNYGRPNPKREEEAYNALIEEVKENARKNGVEL